MYTTSMAPLMAALLLMPMLGQAPVANGPSGDGASRLVLTPRPAPPTGDLDILDFDIAAPWMEGFLTLRFPEFIRSSLGQHFIDHDKPSDRALHRMVRYPEWNRDPATGAVSYAYTDPTGLTFGGRAIPAEDEVLLEFRVENGTGQAISVNPVICLTFTGAAPFNERDELARTHYMSEGRFISLAEITPTPAEKGRSPLLMINMRGNEPLGPLGSDFPPNTTLFWYPHQESDLELFYRTSRDGSRLVGIAFPNTAEYLVHNGGIPCVHAGPTRGVAVEPGSAHVWRGVVYVMENDPAELLRRYRAVAEKWNRE